jgi:hypothetical protein
MISVNIDINGNSDVIIHCCPIPQTMLKNTQWHCVLSLNTEYRAKFTFWDLLTRHLQASPGTDVLSKQELSAFPRRGVQEGFSRQEGHRYIAK